MKKPVFRAISWRRKKGLNPFCPEKAAHTRSAIREEASDLLLTAVSTRAWRAPARWPRGRRAVPKTTITTNLAETISGLAAAALLRSDAAVTPRTLRRCASRLASASTTVAFVERGRADLFFGKGLIIINYPNSCSPTPSSRSDDVLLLRAPRTAARWASLAPNIYSGSSVPQRVSRLLEKFSSSWCPNY